MQLGTQHRSLRRRVVAAILALSVAGLVFSAASLTATGQRVDVTAFEGRKSQPLVLRRSITQLITPAACALSLCLIVVAGRRVASGRLGVARATALGSAPIVSALTCIALKRTLPRPGLFAHPYVTTGNSFPSSHAAVIAAAALGLRASARGAGGVGDTATTGLGILAGAIAILASGWHRPSDVIGGLCVGGAVIAFATPRSGPTLSESRLRTVLPLLAALGLIPIMWSIRETPPDPRHSLAALTAGVLAVAAATTATTWCLKHAGAETPGRA